MTNQANMNTEKIYKHVENKYRVGNNILTSEENMGNRFLYYNKTNINIINAKVNKTRAAQTFPA